MYNEYWFKPKTHGYGAAPANWKGWALIAAFGLAQLMFVLLMMAISADPGTPLWWVLALAAFMLVITAVFIWVTKRQTDGEWRWRWPERLK